MLAYTLQQGQAVCQSEARLLTRKTGKNGSQTSLLHSPPTAAACRYHLRRCSTGRRCSVLLSNAWLLAAGVCLVTAVCCVTKCTYRCVVYSRRVGTVPHQVCRLQLEQKPVKFFFWGADCRKSEGPDEPACTCRETIRCHADDVRAAGNHSPRQAASSVHRELGLQTRPVPFSCKWAADAPASAVCVLKVSCRSSRTRRALSCDNFVVRKGNHIESQTPDAQPKQVCSDGSDTYSSL